ncbi:MAG: hypothetical protein HUU16_15470, partial [Candidatus Omnitrophica bacterium]|nr:hypothetical protein [Candidatus Omnitrophota bacterium]
NRGPMVCWAADLVRSVVHIQQGVPVVRDGVPAPDGAAPLDDNILKAEDGLVLDWRHDRAFHGEAGFAFFDIPVADHLRQWLISSVLWVSREVGIPLPRLGYFPKGASAIAHLSLDTDGNDPELAGFMLDRLKENGVRATWCNILPCYPRDSRVFERIREEGHEIAFHYDSGSDPRIGFRWNREEFLTQYHQVCRAAGVDRILTNKNHYTRWEGGTEFFEWCVEVGVEIESTRGPSKPGTIGFPFGSCHPWFPLDRLGKRIGCLEFPFLTQDPVVTVPACVTGDLHRAVRSVEGIAHFLFHPAHIRKPGVAEALSQVLTEGKSYGGEWWTAAEISAWERRRRAALADARKGDWSAATRTDTDWTGLE